MDKEQLKKMMGLDNSGRTSYYKLNQVTMSGDDGTFRFKDMLSEKEKGAKYPVEDMGKEVSGVILKMRWVLSKFNEGEPSLNSSEYDNKYKDEVIVYPMKDRGNAAAMKEKYNLSTQRVVYFYVPSKKQVVRLIVKASALSGAGKNPGGELGLFEYIDEYASDDILPCQFITECVGVFREGKNQDGSKNRRKDHYAMSFKRGRNLTDSEFEKIQTLMVEVNEKTVLPAEEVEETPDDRVEAALDEALNSAPNPDDIPF